MKKIPLIHDSETKNNLVNKYYYALIPLIIFSIYKNGLLLYTSNLIPFKNILYLIYFYGISIIIGLIISLLFKEEKKTNILTCLIISASVSLNTNMLIYPILLFVSLFIAKYINYRANIEISVGSFTRLVLVLALLINSYSYLNIAEKLGKFNYNYADIFGGFAPGGLASTSLLLMLISLGILCTSKFYKKEIALSSCFSYFILSAIYLFIFQDSNYLKLFLTGNTYFAFIFIASDLYNTPNNRKAFIIYGILIGILTFIFSLINYYEAPYLSILIISIFIPLINWATNKKYLQT